MGGAFFSFTRENSYWLGPVALFAVACLLKNLASKHDFEVSSFFLAPELALSTLASTLSTFVAISGQSVQPENVSIYWKIITSLVIGAIWLLVVTYIHKRFEHLILRPKLQFLVLGLFLNGISLFLFSNTLLNLKIL